ncbi:protein kinase domain-containing protein [Streptomyces avermitilis]|uniref:protein kinase domain-containing protein n=1 Tax=Streptomyces avermitilis TaxID=33903 RepID=UPI00380789DF
MSTWCVPGFTEIRELGAGGSGRVVMAVETVTGARVAIKYLSERLLDDARFRQEFRSEAELLREIASSHVARLHRYVEAPHGAAMVLDLVDGPTLRELLRQEGATVPEAALTVLKGSLLGLSAAHRRGIVHRDYKPENVLVTADAVSKLVDFGIAVRDGSTPCAAAGTPLYMAPEQWQGHPPTPATDVYAATVTFFECVTGFRPYGGDSLAEIATRHTSSDVPAQDAPEAVRPLVLRGMAKDPAERFASADEFLAELEAVATAGYGRDWEDRGRRALATLVVGLLMGLPRPRTGNAETTTEMATTEVAPVDVAATAAGGEHPTDGHGRRDGSRARRTRAAGRAPVLVGAAALLAVATVAGVVANRSSAEYASHATPETGAAGTYVDTTAPSDTSEPSPDHTPQDGPSTGSAPTHGSTSTGPSDPGATMPGDTYTGAAADGGTASRAAGTAVPPDDNAPEPSAAPPRASASDVAMQVSAVRITSLREASQGRGAEVTVIVTTTRSDAFTLELTWYDSDRADAPGVKNGSTESHRFSGRTTYQFTSRHEFTTCPPFWGVQARTTPAAASGGAYQDMGALACILQPRG